MWQQVLGTIGPGILVLLSIAVITAAVALVVILLLFRDPLRDAIKRLRKAGAAEFAAPAPPVSQTDARATDGLSAALQEDPSIRFWEEAIDADILQNNWSDKELIAHLKRGLAYSNRASHFYAALRQVYGTQIFALRNIQASPNGLAEVDLKVIYEEHELRWLTNPSTVDLQTDFLRWLAFLTEWRFVMLQSARWVITDAGRQFLTFAGSMGVTEQAPF